MQAETNVASPKLLADFQRRFVLIFSVFIFLLTVVAAAVSGALAAQRSFLLLYVLSAIVGLLALVGILFFLVAEGTRRKKLISSVAYLFLVFAAIPSAAFLSYQATSREDYMVVSGISTSVVTDSKGKTGHFTLVQEIRALRNGVASLRIRNLGGTGEIKDIKVTVASHGYDVRVENLAGLWQEETRLLPPINKGETITQTLELDLVGGKEEDQVYSISTISRTTEYVEFNLVVPRERPCKSVEAWSTNSEKMREKDPELTPDRTKVTWRATNPLRGREYTVSCNW